MMRRIFVFTLIVLAALLLAACVSSQPTAPPPPTTAPTNMPDTPPVPSTTDVPPGPTYVIYLVALEDGGQAGDEIGCGDSLIAVERGPLPTTAGPVEAALSDLFSIGEQVVGQSGLYNALYQSSLTVESVTLQERTATVELSGDLLMGGVCDGPRVQQQIVRTITQFDGIDQAVVRINGQPLEALLDLSGGAGDDGGSQSGGNPYDIYLVAIEDGGQSGEAIGCGDSVIAVPRGTTTSGSEAIETALNDLFSLKEQYLGQSGLYNALYQSDLAVASVSVEGSAATVALTGQMAVGGVCDEPRFIAQIEHTVLGIPGINSASITVNGTPLADLFSQQ